MKGKKCIGSLILCITFLLSLKLYLNDASALTLNANNVNFNYNTTANGAFDWSASKTIPGQGQPVGSESYITPVKSLRYMQFSYQPIAIDGNHAALHFEANVVSIKNSLQATLIWQYLSSQQITSCFSNSTYLNIENQALSFAQTSWDNGYRNTLTIYGDVTLSGLPSGSTGQSINCNFGNSANTFFISDLPSATTIYLEQIPTSIVFSNNLNDALLAQQIAQYEVQIQLQNQMNDKIDDLSSQSQQNTQDIIDAQDQNTQAIIKSNQKCHGSVNKLNLPDGTFVNNGITWTRSNGSLHGVGTLTGYTYSSSMSGGGTILNLPSGTYTFSFKNAIGSPLWVEFNTRDDDNVRKIVKVPLGGRSVTSTFSNGLKIINIAFGGGTIGEEYDILIENVQVQEGSSATAYEPYGEEVCQNYNEIMENKDNEDRNNLENQSQTTDTQADAASNAAETTGTTLFGAFTQLLTALTNVSGSNCTLPSMQVYSLNLGRMDLCTYTIPSQITALVSIGMVFIIVPLGINLVKRMINLYKEITG